MNIQALQDRAIELWKKDQASARELGKALIAVRDGMQKHGDFTAWWKSKRLDENRVYYCIRVAEGKIAAKRHYKSHETATRIELQAGVWKRFRKICGGRREDMSRRASELVSAWCDEYEKNGGGLVAPEPKRIAQAMLRRNREVRKAA